MYQQLLFDGEKGAPNRRSFTAGVQGNAWFVFYIGGAGGGSYFPGSAERAGRYSYLYDKFRTMGGGSAGQTEETALFIDPKTVFGPDVDGSRDMQFEFTVTIGSGLPGRAQTQGSYSKLTVELRHKITGTIKEFFNADPSFSEPSLITSFERQLGGGRSTRYPWGANQNDNLAPWDSTDKSGNLGGFVDKTVEPALLASGGAGSKGDGFEGGPPGVNTNGGPGGRGQFLSYLSQKNIGLDYAFVDIDVSEEELRRLAEKGAFLGGGGYGGGGLNSYYDFLDFSQDSRTYQGGAGNTKRQRDAPDNGSGGAKGAEEPGHDLNGGSGAIWIWQPIDGRPLEYDENSVTVHDMRSFSGGRIMLRGYQCKATSRLILPTAS